MDLLVIARWVSGYDFPGEWLDEHLSLSYSCGQTGGPGYRPGDLGTSGPGFCLLAIPMCRDTQRKHGTAGWLRCKALLPPSLTARSARKVDEGALVGRHQSRPQVAYQQHHITYSHIVQHFLQLEFRLRSGKSCNACGCRGEIITKGAVEPSHQSHPPCGAECGIRLPGGW